MKQITCICLMTMTLASILFITVPANALTNGTPIDSAPGIKGDIGIDAAQDHVVQFMGSSALVGQKFTYSGTLDSPLGAVYELSQGNNRYYVNEKTGDVEFAYFPGSRSEAGMSVISQNDAYTTALKYAETKYAKFTNTTMIQLESHTYDHGAAGKTYSFSWSEQISGVLTLNRVYVSVDAGSGKILSYQAKTHETMVSLDPKVTESTAKEIAQRAFDNPGESSVDAVLMVVCPDKDSQKLAWVVTVYSVGEHDLPQGGQAVVDAQTGEVLLSNPFN